MKNKVMSVVMIFIITLGIIASPAMTSTSMAATVSGQEIVQDALSWCGKTKYVYGGNDILLCDCSGFICCVYERHGINLWDYRCDFLSGANYIGVNIGTNPANCQPGDIVVWSGHCAIACDNSTVVQCQTTGGVAQRSFSYMQTYWGSIKGIIRLYAISSQPVNHLPTGHVDKCELTSNGIRVAGWAFDSDESQKSLSIHVYVNGTGVGICNASNDSPDVNATYGISGKHRFDATFPVNVSGQCTVDIYAIDSQNGSPPNIGHITIKQTPPCGCIDYCEIRNNKLYCAGWVYDPDRSSESVTLHIYVNGKGIAEFVANNDSPDVDSAFGISGKHRFDVNIDLPESGTLSVCVYALDYNAATMLGKSPNQATTYTLYKAVPTNYTVSFNANGHGNTPASQTVTAGNKASKPTDPTATGYAFDGWYKDSACTTAYNFDSAVTGNITLYAKWTANSYTVTFNSNGHGTAPSSQSVTYGNKVTKPSDPTATGYTFGGWYTNSACTTAYNFDSAVTGNVTLYAKWTVVPTTTPTATPTPTPVVTSAPTATPIPEPVVTTPTLTTGIAHIQDIGNVTSTDDSNGVLTIGTAGSGKRIEEITIYFENPTSYSGTLEYRVHVQDIGWMEWTEAGQTCGTEGMGKRIEAIEIRLTGELSEYYSVQYCAYIQDYGYMQGWVHDGAIAGTSGEAKRIEELKIKIIPIGTDSSMTVKYRVHVQDYGWEGAYASNGQMSGTSGESKRLEGIEIFLDGNQYSGGVKFKTHVQDYGWQGWSYDGEMSGTQGEAKRLEGICIELYGEVAEYYDIYYRVHAQDIGWMAWAKNGECAGTAGRSARLEGIQIVLVPKGSPAPGATYEDITAVTDKAFIEGF